MPEVSHDVPEVPHDVPGANRPPAASDFPGALQALFALACGVMVANVYYAQPLVALIAPELGIGEHAAGVVVTTAQLGYAAALLLITPLADLVENRRLVLSLTLVTIVALAGVALSQSSTAFLLFAFLAGAGSTGAQILVPLATHLSPVAVRGRIIGNIMAGLLGGIMLARPLSSFIAAHWGWRAVFWTSAGLMMGVGGLLYRALPARRPQGGLRYDRMLASIGQQFRAHPLLRRRTAYQALVFATFQLLWTAVPLELAGRFGLSQSGIALFALVGAGGALSAPLAGRIADRGWTRAATGWTLLAVVTAFAMSQAAVVTFSLIGLALSALLLDAAAQSNQIFSQRVIYSLDASARARINAGYMTIVFVAGAGGSFLGALTFATGGWMLTAATGGALGLAALVLFSTEFMGDPAPAPHHAATPAPSTQDSL